MNNMEHQGTLTLPKEQESKVETQEFQFFVGGKSMFDIKDLSDLPKEVKDQVGAYTKGQTTFVEALFREFPNNILNANNIIVALYRRFQLTKKRPAIASCLHILHTNGKIEKVSPGHYKYKA